MADFNKALVKTLKHEGVFLDPTGKPMAGKTGHGNHPDDPGKETNYGITRVTALENGYNGPMKDIPFSKVVQIYRDKFWDELRLTEIQDQEIAEEMFDTAVNCHPRIAGKFLQRVLNVLNKKGERYDDIAVDGAVGPKTIGTLKKALSVAPYYRLLVLRGLDGLQCNRYIELCEKKEFLESFAAGWLRNRIGVKGD